MGTEKEIFGRYSLAVLLHCACVQYVCTVGATLDFSHARRGMGKRASAAYARKTQSSWESRKICLLSPSFAPAF